MPREGELTSIETVDHQGKHAGSLQAQPRTEWLTAKEAAAHLKVQPRTILQWAKDGKIPGHVLSGTKRCTWRFLRPELDAMLSTPSAALTNRRIQ
jgi:excisionase family DNA binding protein